MSMLRFGSDHKLATVARLAPSITAKKIAGPFAVNEMAALLLLLLGAAAVVLPGADAPDAADVADAAGGAVPVGTENPVTPPAKGPAGADAEAP